MPASLRRRDGGLRRNLRFNADVEEAGFHPIACAVIFRKTLKNYSGRVFLQARLAGTLKRKTGWRGAESAKRRLCLLAIFLVSAGIVESVFGQGGTRVVTNLYDGRPGSLRQEIAIANAGDTITFAVHGTIVLTKGELQIIKD